MKTFDLFSNGALKLPHSQKKFSSVEWSKHPTFEGVQLKHLLTAKETCGKFSYHLVKIAPNKSIKNHIHELQLETHEVIYGSGECINNNVSLTYEPGIISIFPAKTPHEINAGNSGLQLLAKFFPALC